MSVSQLKSVLLTRQYNLAQHDGQLLQGAKQIGKNDAATFQTVQPGITYQRGMSADFVIAAALQLKKAGPVQRIDMGGRRHMPLHGMGSQTAAHYTHMRPPKRPH